MGQPETVATLQRAVSEQRAMTHAWLVTGPPGSGRSVAARAFAAALECPDGGCGECRECRTVLDGTHADVKMVATEGLTIKVELARDLAMLAGHAPAVGPVRVLIIEDADRLTDRAADALLKAIEEPAARTVWLLCAPTPDDVIVTVRSRCRHLRLRTPPVADVARVLVERDGIDPALASYAAKAAQSHIGIARRLARDEGSRNRRHEVVSLPTRIVGLGDALTAADNLHSVAQEEAAASSAARDADEKEKLLAQLGADLSARTQPPYIRSQISALEKEQKARATRVVRDVIDSCLTDLLSVYRDALVRSSGSSADLINATLEQDVTKLAQRWGADGLLRCMEAIGLARERLLANGAPLLVLEALMIDLRLPRQ